jgi:hypothetical protein
MVSPEKKRPVFPIFGSQHSQAQEHQRPAFAPSFRKSALLVFFRNLDRAREALQQQNNRDGQSRSSRPRLPSELLGPCQAALYTCIDGMPSVLHQGLLWVTKQDSLVWQMDYVQFAYDAAGTAGFVSRQAALHFDSSGHSGSILWL